MFPNEVKKDHKVETHIIELLAIPMNSPQQGPFLTSILDGGADDADKVHLCCSTWKNLFDVVGVWNRLPDQLKRHPSFRLQFFTDVNLGSEPAAMFSRLPDDAKSDVALCNLFVDKCVVERRKGLANDRKDRNFLPDLYMLFPDFIKRSADMQRRCLDKCSKCKSEQGRDELRNELSDLLAESHRPA